MSRPKLLESPSKQLPCNPTLFLGVADWAVEALTTVVAYDLAFAKTSSYQPNLSNRNLVLDTLSSLEGKDLLQLTKQHGGSVIVREEELYDDSVVIQDRLNDSAETMYNAIIVGDHEVISIPEITRFCSKQFHNKKVSVVIMALEGLYDISVINDTFGVHWHYAAYTKRDLCLSASGEKILSSRAFPSKSQYIKANYIRSDWPEEEHLLMNDPESEDNDPGSAVVASIRKSNAVSYFGFVSSPLELYGPIIHRLCYAAEIQQLQTRPKPVDLPTTTTTTAPAKVHFHGVTLHFDGACMPNPGEGGSGYIAWSEKGDEILEGGYYVGNDCTNNVAEYFGLIKGLTRFRDSPHTTTFLTIKGDSELVINQVKGTYQLHSDRLRPLLRRVHQLLSNLRETKRVNSISFQLVNRENNILADQLAKNAIQDKTHYSHDYY